MNVVVTGAGDFVEVQGTAEGAPFRPRRARRAAGPRGRRLRRADEAAAGGTAPRDSGRCSPPATRRSSRSCGASWLRTLPDVDVVGLDDVAGLPRGARDRRDASPRTRCSRRMRGFGHTGLPTVADDSGLTVDALNGMPGVLSARWAGGHGDDDGEPAACRSTSCATCPTSGSAPRSCARWRWSGPASRRRCDGRMAGRLIRETARHQRVRLRPDLRARRLRRHQRRARPEEQGRASATAAGRCARCCRSWSSGWVCSRRATFAERAVRLPLLHRPELPEPAEA